MERPAPSVAAQTGHAEAAGRPLLPFAATAHATDPMPDQPEVLGRAITAAETGIKSADGFMLLACRYKCGHCFLTTAQLHDTAEISLQQLRSMLGWAAETGSRIEEFTYLGGEFSQYSQAAKVLEMTVSTRNETYGRPILPRVVTNGAPSWQRLLDNDGVVDIMRMSRGVSVSIEAADQKLNDHIRGRGASANAWKTVRMQRKKGITTTINCTVMRSTVHDAENLARLGREEGASRINYHSFSPIGRGSGMAGEALMPIEWAQFCEQMAKYYLREVGSPEAGFDVDIELAYDSGIPSEAPLGVCAIKAISNLQFCPPRHPGDTDLPVYSCGLLMPEDNMNGFIFRDGMLYERTDRSHTELQYVAHTHGGANSHGCPLPSRKQEDGHTPRCVYTRLNQPAAAKVLEEKGRTEPNPTIIGYLAARGINPYMAHPMTIPVRGSLESFDVQ